ncbi:unnamed protein product [Brassica napus]|uniref:(rape) hypothetical protein n=1 Tax=Brassica napus TaxID=3708 RepID=A0A816RLA6_BRANA|nr:unnamed protein product [Brassica napus]
MFHIPHQPARHWIIQRGVWHIDDCLLFVLPWTPEGSFKIPEISTLPVWANLKNVPDCCYSRLGISHVASGLGEPILTHKPRLDPTSMGEAKVLVEMELDKDFPKLIALDDKQGHIFLVNVEYTWIPSMCERCGNLGHKAKRCLLPPTTAKAPATTSDSKEIPADVPVLDIDTVIDIVLQEMDNATSSSLATGKKILQANENPSPADSDDSEIHTTAKKGLQSEADIMQPLHSSDIVLDHHVTDTTTASLPSSPLTQQVTHTASLNFFKTLPTLVDSSSTPITTLIMESSPSTFINTEVQGTYVVDPLTTTPMSCVFESPSRYTLLGDGDEAETGASCSLSLTRGTREIKPPAKYQDMDWKTVRGRGKRGRRGRGSHH